MSAICNNIQTVLKTVGAAYSWVVNIINQHTVCKSVYKIPVLNEVTAIVMYSVTQLM